MSKVTYEVTLSPDGKHFVSVKSDDPLSLKGALPLAKEIQEKLLEVAQAETPSPAPKNQPSSQRDRAQLRLIECMFYSALGDRAADQELGGGGTEVPAQGIG